VASAYVPAWTDRNELWAIDGDAVRWFGVIILFVARGAWRIWPVYELGNRFSGLVAIQRGRTIVTTGIYSVVRQFPMYVAPHTSARAVARYRSGHPA
jgi:protein-S-isoprenylcysteine O-methyltransferase Ste14